MGEKARLLWAVIASAAILIGYNLWFAPKPLPVPATAPAKTAGEVSPPSAPSGEAPPAAMPLSPLSIPEVARSPRVPIERKTAYGDLAWDSWGGDVSAWRLAAYRETAEAKSPPIDLVRDPEILRHFAVFLDGSGPSPSDRLDYRVLSQSETELVLVKESPSLSLTLRYRWHPDKPVVDIEVAARNLGTGALKVAPGLIWQDRPIAKATGFLSSFRQPSNHRVPLGFWDGKRQTLNKEGDTRYRGQVYWAGIEERYFLAAMIPVDGEAEAHLSYSADRVASAVVYPEQTLMPGGEAKSNFRVYLGPKVRDDLIALQSRLEEGIDYGWFSLLAVPLLWLLKAFHSGLHNWGLAIIALTLLLKILLNPVTRKSFKSMKALQALQPELAKLREKYQNDRERLNVEMMQLFKTHKANPVGGCLPMLLQMPIYIALYKVLYTAIELYHAPFFAFYKDLSAPDPYFIAPILLGIFMVLQQKFTPSTTADPMQQKMMMIMPVMFSVFMLFLPSGLVIYIFVNTALSVAQQWMIREDLRFRDFFRKVFARPAAK